MVPLVLLVLHDPPWCTFSVKVEKAGIRADQSGPCSNIFLMQEHDEGSKAGGRGIAHGQSGCSSLRVRGWWMLTLNSHGVEISIARGVVEMVHETKSYIRGCPFIGVLPSTLILRDS